jgi:predicted negative regulator of RcsB-dependent stress response
MKTKQIIGIILFSISAITALCLLGLNVYATYRWNKELYSYWNLADKSSTLSAKSDYIDKFVEALEKEKLAEYNAIFLKTPDNNVKNNLEALKTLQKRLHEAKSMDINSFEYQKAIEQITAQEQGEAKEMIETLKGGWLLANYPYLWAWFQMVVWGMVLLIGFVGLCLI